MSGRLGDGRPRLGEERAGRVAEPTQCGITHFAGCPCHEAKARALADALEKLILEVDSESPWRGWPEGKIIAFDGARAALRAWKGESDG